MPVSYDSAVTRPLSPLLGWRRVRVVLATSLVISLIMWPDWQASYAVLIARLLFVGFSALLVFGFFERWPMHLPRWLARWALQVASVALTIPFAAAIAYTLTTFNDPQPWFLSKARMEGFGFMCGLGILAAPWIAMSALYRQISGVAQKQALAFELARTELERQTLNTRLNLLQAQVEPHFLFNTLANIRELVDSGSPQASAVLNSLIAYLRAAVPRLHAQTTSLGQELELVRAYLEVMQMRMPDRLRFTLHADADAMQLDCPSATLLTLVENAVRHGIDPSEEGGLIEVRVRVEDGRCHAEVADSGVGLNHSGDGLGSGLSNLRERLQLTFAGDAQLRLRVLEPHGARSEVEFPARRSAR